MNKTEKKLIPELRFPEFENESEWEYLNGDKLFEPISNKNHNSDLPILAITQEQGAIPRELIDYNIAVSEKSIKSYKVVEVGDFIISLRSFQGGIEYSNYLGLCSPAYIVLRKKQNISNDFYRHYFKSFPFIQDLNKNLEGIRDGKMVSYKQFSDILIPKPIKPEQQKIASCLSSFDELIAAHNDKLKALKDHKKGLMQNLFPQIGEKVPKFRFPEFKKDGEWDRKILGEISESESSSLALNKIEHKQNGYPVYGADSIVGYIDEFQQEEKYISIVKDGSGVGRLNLCQPKSSILGTLTCIKSKDSKRFNLDWIYYLMNTIEFSSYKKGSGIPHIYFSDFKNEPIGVPKPQEQQKIASCLSSLDELITAQAEKIEQLQQHKKGLMQGLFPKTVST